MQTHDSASASVSRGMAAFNLHFCESTSLLLLDQVYKISFSSLTKSLGFAKKNLLAVLFPKRPSPYLLPSLWEDYHAYGILSAKGVERQ